MKSWKIGLVAVLAMVGAVSHAGMQFSDGTSTVLGVFSDARCAQGVNCSVVSGKVNIAVGQQTQTTGSSTQLTAYQCGQTYVNSGTATVMLPLASQVVGCRYTFIVGNASSFDIDPQNADQIQVLTNAAGDRIRSATVGHSVVLQALISGSWVAVGKEQGTWSDVN